MAESDSKQTDYYDLLDVSRTAGASEIERGFRKTVRSIDKLSSSSCTTDDAVQAYRVLKDPLKRILYDKELLGGGDTSENTPIPLPKNQWPSSAFRQRLSSNANVSAGRTKSARNTFLDEYSKKEKLLEKALQTTGKQMHPKAHREEEETALNENDTQTLISRLKCHVQNGNLSSVLSTLSDRRRANVNLAVDQLVTSGFSEVGDRAGTVLELVKGFYYIRQFPNDSERIRTAHDCLNKAFWNGVGVHKEMAETIAKLLVDEFNQTGFFLANSMFCSSRELLSFIQEDEKELIEQNSGCVNSKWSTTRGFEESLMTWKEEGEWSDMDVALAYADMGCLCSRPSEMAMARANAARWLLRAMKFSNVEKVKLPLYMEMVYEFAQECVAIAYGSLSASMKFFFTRLCLAVCKEAGRIGGGSRKEVDICVAYMRRSAFYSQFVPLWGPPNVSVSDIEQVNVAYTELQNAFMTHLNDVEADRMPIRRALISYSLFENNQQSALAEDCLSLKYREMAMIDLLKEHQMSMGDVQNWMRCPLFERDANGWYQRSDRLLNSHQLEGFRGIHGFTIDKKTNEIRLLVDENPDPDLDSYSAGDSILLWWDDIVETLSMENKFSHGLSFNLGHPDENFLKHPFQAFSYQPDSLRDSLFLSTLFHVDYILKQLALGFEISSKPPFVMRRCSKNGLYKGLPDRIMRLLKPVTERGCTMETSKLWIHADELQFAEKEDNSQVKFLIGDVKMSVRSEKLVRDADGKLLDAAVDSCCTNNSAEQNFCDDFTRNYNKISRYFPEFARLKELCKLDFIMTRLRRYELDGVHTGLITQLKMLGQAANTVLQSEKKCRRTGLQWVPAAFCPYLGGRVLHGGVNLSPVSVPTVIQQSNYLRVRLGEDVFEKHDGDLVANLAMCREAGSIDTAGDTVVDSGRMTVEGCCLGEQSKRETEDDNERQLVTESMNDSIENDMSVDDRPDSCDTSDRDIDKPTRVSADDGVIPSGGSIVGSSERGLGTGESEDDESGGGDSGGMAVESETRGCRGEQSNSETEDDNVRHLVAESICSRENSDNDVSVLGRCHRCDTSDHDADRDVSGDNGLTLDDGSVGAVGEPGVCTHESADEDDVCAESGSDDNTDGPSSSHSDDESDEGDGDEDGRINRGFVEYLRNAYGAMWSWWENLKVAVITSTLFSKVKETIKNMAKWRHSKLA